VQSLTESKIRTSFVNSTLRERKELLLPAGFPDLRWADIDYLGWVDPKIPGRAYVLAEIGDDPIGVVLRRSGRATRSRAMCNWCEDVQLPNDVAFFSARRAGAGGRAGNTLGTLVCAGFECPVNVRRLPPAAYEGFDREAERRRRIDALQRNVRAFVVAVATGR